VLYVDCYFVLLRLVIRTHSRRTVVCLLSFHTRALDRHTVVCPPELCTCIVWDQMHTVVRMLPPRACAIDKHTLVCSMLVA
jgi:hypothetical protein